MELIRIEEDKKRKFYLNECINCRWSVRELQRQTGSLLYERLALSKNKQKVLELATKGQVLETGKDLVKDTFVLEFLDIKENIEYLESELEKNILKHLKEFILELGKGLAILESPVPREELIEIELQNDVIKIDGNMAVAWSDTLNFTVEKSGKSLLGSAVSAEGFVNVYRGTGKILLAPVLSSTGYTLGTLGSISMPATGK